MSCYVYTCPRCNYVTIQHVKLDMICAECPGVVRLDAHELGAEIA